MTYALEAENVSKRFGNVEALRGVSAAFAAGEVTCVLGDNGAGKSTLIKILAGVHPPDEGTVKLEGRPTRFDSPRDALAVGIATVYQDLAIVPLMSVWRNFVLGNEPTRRVGPLRPLQVASARRTAVEEMRRLGIVVEDPEQPVGTMSGGERQSLAIARAIHNGAKVLILDEPTAALGVKQAGIVLRHIVMAKRRGLAVILITHNPNHAYPVGDHFILLQRGRKQADLRKGEVSLDDLMRSMAGGEDFRVMVEELNRGADGTDGTPRGQTG
ncbi:MAG TPA: ATP-binding cassette domain-containing protein [Actinomycetota bacterium]|nr:ATP-binding cassette domain-containing protein [Actinomycetota bacterium]